MKAYFLRTVGQPLILSDIPSLDISGEGTELELYASAPLCDTDRRYASTVLRNEASAAVRLWIQNKRYFPRLIISAAVFLVAYVLASFLIRDPLPMIDEILIGLAAAAAAWVLLSRNDAKATVAKEKEKKLFRIINTAEVLCSGSLKALEDCYLSLFSYDTAALCSKLVRDELEAPPVTEDVRASALCYLRTHEPLMLKDIEKIKAGKKKEKTEEELLHLATTTGLDIYQTAFFYLLLK